MPVDRIVLVKLDGPYATPAGRAEVAAHTRTVFAKLPGVTDLRVGVPADDAAEKSWDLSITVRFARLADVDAYRVHPDHRTYVDEYLAPRMQVLKAWNFELP
ncbi:MAG: Dabb family protein [Myxococcales bacterium]|nr:Dabb family protein [Myxococcales bacterium]